MTFPFNNKSSFLSSTLCIITVAIGAVLWKAILWPLGLRQDDCSEQSCEFFSHNYTQARQRFRQAVQPNFDQYYRLVVRRDDDDSFSLDDDKDFTMDIIIRRPKFSSQRTVFHSSGVHGVEGYAGSAIQLAALQRHHDFCDDATVVYIHAVNPVGMHKFRRTNEENVDLNRHAIDDWETVVTEKSAKSVTYNALANDLWSTNHPMSDVELVGRGLRALYTYGHDAIKATMVGGQYHDPDAMFYGGAADRRQASLSVLREFVSTHKESWTTATATKDNFVWIDVHTGLGPFGVDTLLSHHPGHEERFDVLFPDRPRASGAAVSKGYEQTQGFFVDGFRDLLGDFLPVTQEFGTLPTVWMARALIRENADRHSGNSSYLLKDAFYPSSSSFWRRNVVERGLHVLEQACKGVKQKA